jgi:hypothetical protein
MKKIFISALIMCFLNTMAQTNPLDSKLIFVNQSTVTSGIIYERSMRTSFLFSYNQAGSLHNTADFNFFEKSLAELHKASNQTKLISTQTLKNRIALNNKTANVVDIGIINTPFEVMNYDAVNPQNGGLTFDGTYFRQIAGKVPFYTLQAVIVAPLKEVVIGNSITYKFKNSLILNNGNLTIKTLTANFGDGITRTIISNRNIIANSITVNNSVSNAIQKITFNFTFNNNQTLTTYGSVFVAKNTTASNNLPSINSTVPCGSDPDLEDLYPITNLIQADEAYLGLGESFGIKAKLEAKVFYQTQNNPNHLKILRKPILIVDGFDPSDKRKITDCDCENDPTGECQKNSKNPVTKVYDPEFHNSLQELMDYKDALNDIQNFIETVRKKGFDVIVVNQPNYEVVHPTIPSRNVEIPAEYDADGNLITAAYTITVPNLIPVDGGADFVERNAMGLVKLIQNVNGRLTTNGSTEKLVILGPSMGGQISRYALAYMEKRKALATTIVEQNKWNHNTRLWGAFDSPNHGANVPLGNQALLNILRDGGAEPSAEKIYSKGLNSTASKEMLIELHSQVGSEGAIDNSLLNGSTTTQGMPTNSGNPFFQAHYNNQYNNGLPNSKGFPMNLRKIAIVNGSLTGARPQGSDLSCLLDERLFTQACFKPVSAFGILGWGGGPSICYTTKLAEMQCWAMPSSGNFGRIAYFRKFTLQGEHANATNFNSRGNMDLLPGGLINATEEIHKSVTGTSPINTRGSFWQYTIDNASYWYVNKFGSGSQWETRAMNPKQCFIPTFSSIGIKNPNQNWATPLDRNLVCSNEIYFDSYFGEAENTNHTELNYRSVNWLLKELAGNPQAPHFPIQPNQLTGDNLICDTQIKTYTIADICKVPSPVKYNDQNGTAINGWSVQGNLTIVSSTPYTVTVQGTSNLGSTGKIIATFQNGQTTEKEVWIGSPKFPITGIVTGPPNTVYNQTLTYVYNGAYPLGGTSTYQWYVNAPINDGAGPQCNWQILSGQGTNAVTVKTGCINTTAVVAVRVTNQCGADEKYMYVTISAGGTSGGGGTPCVPSLKIYPNPIKGSSLQMKVIPPAEPCDPNQKIIKNNLKMYDFYGNMVYENSFDTDDIKIDNLYLKNGNYILNVTTEVGESIKEIIVVE